MRLAILGFGLIGGSIARALSTRERDRWDVTVWSRTAEAPRQALRNGIVGAVAPDAQTAIRGVELVLLSASPLANLELLASLGPSLAATETTVSDVSSSQGAIGRRASAIAGLRFVGGHPMSGRERRGFAAASADLFVDRPWVLLPGAVAGEEDLGRVRRLVRACGARPVEMDADEHDRAVAAVSHLPLLASVALAETVLGAPDASRATQLAGGGWRDMTRLARGDAELGSGILALNATAVMEWLRRYLETLMSWERELSALAQAEQSTIEDVSRAAAPAAERLGRVAHSLARDAS